MEEPAAGDSEKKPEPIEETPPPLEDKPQPAPKALEKPKPIKPDVKKADEVKEKKPEPKPVPAPEKPKAKPKPPEKKPEPEQAEEEETSTDFMSVLKNLQDSEPAADKNDGPKVTEAPVGQAVTQSEIGALRRQLSQCWNLLPGAAKAETLAVELTITVNRDRTVRDVQILDRARYNSDTFFRAAADNALRAIKHPNCTPLDLPPEKYTMWKEMTLNFDPQKMF
jgi:outer membrane biosynthesis protein TonB